MKPLRDRLDDRALFKTEERMRKKGAAAQLRQEKGMRPKFFDIHPRIAMALGGGAVAIGVLTFSGLRENGGDKLIKDAVGSATEEGIGGVKSATGIVVGAATEAAGEALPDCITIGDAQVGSVDGCNSAAAGEPIDDVDLSPTASTQPSPEQPDATPEIVSPSVSVAEGAGGLAVARQCLGLPLDAPINEAIKSEWERIQTLPENAVALSDSLQPGETIFC